MRYIFALLLMILPAHAIVGGSGAGFFASEKKSVVFLFAKKGEACSATLIERDILLTAAHCLSRGKQHYVVFGKVQRVISVKKFVIHPQYRPFRRGKKSFSPDLALVKLSEPAPDYYEPVALTGGIEVGSNVKIAGWGKTNFRERPSFDQLNSTSILAAARVSPHHIGLVDSSTALRSEGKGGCSGDSGGAAFYNGGLAGVLMMASGIREEGCGGITLIVTIDNSLAWINATMGKFRR